MDSGKEGKKEASGIVRVGLWVDRSSVSSSLSSVKSFKDFTPSAANGPKSDTNAGGRKQSTAASSTPKTTQKVETKLKNTAKEFVPKEGKRIPAPTPQPSSEANPATTAAPARGNHRRRQRGKANGKEGVPAPSGTPAEGAALQPSSRPPRKPAPKPTGKPAAKPAVKPTGRTNAKPANSAEKPQEQAAANGAPEKKKPSHRRRNNRKPAARAFPRADDDNMSVASTVSAVSTISTLSSVSTISNSDLPLRERLERDLGHQKYTCAICMDTIKRHQLIWSCRECFVVLHLFCMKEWIFKYLDTVTMDSLPKQARDPSSGRGWLASP